MIQIHESKKSSTTKPHRERKKKHEERTAKLSDKGPCIEGTTPTPHIEVLSTSAGARARRCCAGRAGSLSPMARAAPPPHPLAGSPAARAPAAAKFAQGQPFERRERPKEGYGPLLYYARSFGVAFRVPGVSRRKQQRKTAGKRGQKWARYGLLKRVCGPPIYN